MTGVEKALLNFLVQCVWCLNSVRNVTINFHGIHPILSLCPERILSVDLGAKIRQLQSGQSVSISSVTVSGSSLAQERGLECDEVCAQEERNRRLAAALEIDDPIISPVVNTETQYSAFLMDQARCVCV